MGRTTPTFRDVLAELEDRWQQYRRGLRAGMQPRFDRLFEYAREHADASGYHNPGEPLWAVLFSIALEQERRLDALEERVRELEDTPPETE